jgi:hypothetical protein
LYKALQNIALYHNKIRNIHGLNIFNPDLTLVELRNFSVVAIFVNLCKATKAHGDDHGVTILE